MKISIITACFNSEKTIKKTIESILSQEYNNIEYILIDGDSSDSTISIIDNYKNNVAKVISEKDNGIYDALNKGIALATGDIIGFLHSDDYYPNPSIISTVVDNFKNNHIDMVWGNIAYVDGNGECKRHYSGKNINFNVGVMPPHPSVFIKRKSYQKHGEFNLNYKIASDYDLLFRFIVLNKLTHLYDKNIIINMTPGGTSTKNIFSTIRLNKEIYQIHKSHNRPIRIMNLLKKIPRRLGELFA